jgi:hypothetical protein
MAKSTKSNTSIVPIESKEIDLLDRLAKLTGTITAKTVQAWNVLTTGQVPPEHLLERPGYPKPVKYVNHTYAQRLMNEAFRWNWDFEVITYQVHEDGSVSSITKMSVHIPVTINKQTGEPIYKTRVITEVGAFESYFKKDKGAVVLDALGKPEFTMSTADRVASSVSRGLVKCMERAFNIGSELKQADNTMTPLDAWNALLAFGRNQGLTREAIIEILKSLDITKDTLLDRFYEAYEAVYQKAKGLETQVPLEG